jgi:hypothetical protein
MDRSITHEELREIQEPLKRRCGDDPAAALITLQAEGRLEEGSPAPTLRVSYDRA